MLQTENLRLVPLTHEQLKLYKSDPQALAEELGIKYMKPNHDPTIIGELEEATDFWIKGTMENPDLFYWYTNWHIILKEEEVAIGGMGFNGKPNAEGEAMVGYGFDMRYHGRGFATEALRAVIAWAFSQPSVRVLVAETPQTNIPSHRVLEKNGFRRTNIKDDLICWTLNKR